MSNVTTGVVAFSNLTEMDVYQGRSTGKYSIVLTMDNKNAANLEAQGVKLKTYQPEEGPAVAQRKFATKFPVSVVDIDGEPVAGELGHGSEVRIWWTGKHSEEHGLVPYLGGVRVLVLQEAEGEAPEEF